MDPHHFESGPIFGLAFLLWRAALTAYLGFVSLRALTRAEILPLLLFSAGFLIILNGQLGQPTSLGIPLVLNRISPASTQPAKMPSVPISPTLSRLLRRRPTYAANLQTRGISNLTR